MLFAHGETDCTNEVEDLCGEENEPVAVRIRRPVLVAWRSFEGVGVGDASARSEAPSRDATPAPG